MNQFDTVQISALVGWLVLAAGALASFRLSWKSGLRLALIWATIFLTVYLFITLIL